MSELIYSTIYGELTKAVQVRFDKVSELNKKLFDNVLFEQYLDWDAPTIGLDFEEIIGQYNITVAAPTIGENAKEPILGSEGLKTLKERILNHAITRPMTMQTYRKVLQLLDSKSISDKAKTEQLITLMWGDVTSVTQAILAKLDLIFLRALSNEGKVTLDADLNPEGGARGLIDYNQPGDNIVSCTGDDAWTATNAKSVDCMEHIQKVLDAAQDKVVLSKILCSPAVLSYICRTSLVKKMVFGSDKSSSILTPAALNQYMLANGWPTFVPIRRSVRIQTGPSVSAPVSPWIEANMVFVPDGKLGVVKNAFANNELKPEAGVAYSNYGRIRVSQWGVGESQGSNAVEFTKAQCYALPVITEMDGIYTLKTGYVKPTSTEGE